MENKRKSERVDDSRTVLVFSYSEIYHGYMIDLSTGGVSIILTQAPHLGAGVVLEFAIHKTRIKVAAVPCDTTRREQHDGWKIGFAFEHLDMKSFRIIQDRVTEIKAEG